MLQTLKDVDLKTVNRDDLVQRSTVKIDPNATREERLQSYIKQIKNPYCYMDGKTAVKLSFSNTTTTMEDCIAHYLKGV